MQDVEDMFRSPLEKNKKKIMDPTESDSDLEQVSGKPFSDMEPGESKTVVLTLEDCTHCETLKEHIKEDLDSGKIEEVHLGYKTDEDIQNYNYFVTQEVLAFPTVARVTKKQDGVEFCEVDLKTGKIKECRKFLD